jgi:2-keto-4-pentenoate hydratase/2-oxohepta-3-ene-1,7-dioic acid hydratase in catechol pathway
VLTGTPAGIGPLAFGDRVSVAIQGIGTLTNPVVDRD